MAINEIDGMWDGSEAESFVNRLQPGTYRGEIKDFKLAQSDKKKTWYLAILIRVILPVENAGLEVEKNWWLTPKTMPYLARDMKALGCPLDPKKVISEQLQKLPITGLEVDFKYDYGKDDKYPQVQWVNLASNSANPPQGEGQGATGKKASPQDEDKSNTKLPF